MPASQKPIDRVSDFLTGETTGDIQANKNYNTSPEVFSFGPPAGEVWLVSELRVAISDAGDMSANEYGNTGGLLANGYSVKVVDSSGDVVSLTGTPTIQVNAGLNAVGSSTSFAVGVTGATSLLVAMDLAKAGAPVRLIGDKGEKVSVSFSDDLTGLTYHTFFCEGVKEER